MATVYVVNKGAHDFDEAKEWTTEPLVFLTEGRINRFNPVDMKRDLDEALKDSNPEDFIVLCSLNILNVVACGILINKHKKLNVLLFKKGVWEDGKRGRGIYLERNIVFD
jgi:hypothetical protein